MRFVHHPDAGTFAKTALNKVLRILVLPTVLAVSVLLMVPSSFATELNPADNIKPTQSEPSLGNVPEKSTLTVDQNKAIKNDTKSTEPSWWNWVTNASNKPANYHFIDILELLS